MPDTRPNLNKLSRTKVTKILENHGYAVYDNETMESLLHTLGIDLDSGEIEASELEGE